MHPIYPWILASTPGLAEAIEAETTARDALASLPRPERSMDEVGVRVDANTWKPKPGVPFTEFDAVRVEHDHYDASHEAAVRRLNRATETYEEFLYGGTGKNGVFAPVLDAAIVAARQKAGADRVTAIDHEIATRATTAQERAALHAERIVAYRWAFLPASSSHRTLASGLGTSTIGMSCLVIDPATRQPVRGDHQVAVTLRPDRIDFDDHEGFRIPFVEHLTEAQILAARA